MLSASSKCCDALIDLVFPSQSAAEQLRSDSSMPAGKTPLLIMRAATLFHQQRVPRRLLSFMVLNGALVFRFRTNSTPQNIPIPRNLADRRMSLLQIIQLRSDIRTQFPGARCREIQPFSIPQSKRPAGRQRQRMRPHRYGHAKRNDHRSNSRSSPR